MLSVQTLWFSQGLKWQSSSIHIHTNWEILKNHFYEKDKNLNMELFSLLLGNNTFFIYASVLFLHLYMALTSFEESDKWHLKSSRHTNRRMEGYTNESDYYELYLVNSGSLKSKVPVAILQYLIQFSMNFKQQRLGVYNP